MKRILYIFVLGYVCCYGVYAQKAKIEIYSDSITIIEVRNIDCEIEVLEDGTGIPKGYTLIAKGKIDVGIATLKCKERRMVNLAKDKACKIGCDAIRFYDITEFKCFVAKILFLKKKVN